MIGSISPCLASSAHASWPSPISTSVPLRMVGRGLGSEAGFRLSSGFPRVTMVRQQMRGNGSPTSMSTIRVPPMEVRRTTIPGGSA